MPLNCRMRHGGPIRRESVFRVLLGVPSTVWPLRKLYQEKYPRHHCHKHIRRRALNPQFLCRRLLGALIFYSYCMLSKASEMGRLTTQLAFEQNHRETFSDNFMSAHRAKFGPATGGIRTCEHSVGRFAATDESFLMLDYIVPGTSKMNKRI